MNDIFLLTGGNMGDRLHNLQQAYVLIEKSAGKVTKKSSIYETAAWGYTEQAPFLNQVVCINSELEPEKLLQQLLTIEQELGRKRIEKMGPRIIDIDILFYGNLVVSEAGLIVPHPRIAERRFVLMPLNEIAANFVHPVYYKTVSDLLILCPDPLDVKIYQPTW